LELGELHFGRKKKQPRPDQVRAFYDDAKTRLKFPILHFGAEQILSIGLEIQTVIKDHGYTCYACAVMPDHVHVLIRKHRDDAWDMLECLQEATRKIILKFDPNIDCEHPVWTNGGYVNFVSTPEIVQRVIRYIENNPAKINLSTQLWPFVTPYDNWPYHKLKKWKFP